MTVFIVFVLCLEKFKSVFVGTAYDSVLFYGQTVYRSGSGCSYAMEGFDRKEMKEHEGCVGSCTMLVALRQQRMVEMSMREETPNFLNYLFPILCRVLQSEFEQSPNQTVLHLQKMFFITAAPR